MKKRAMLFVLAWCSLIAMGGMCGSEGLEMKIAGVTPDPGEINVLLDQTVEMTTGIQGINLQPIDRNTLNTDNFFVKDSSGNLVPGTVGGDVPPPASTITAVFTPTDPWKEGETYTATITTGLQVIMNDEPYSLPEDYSWSFTVRKWFEVGDVVSPDAGGAERPVMMVVDVTAGSQTPAVGYYYNSSQENLQFFDGTSWGPSEADPTGGAAQSSDGAPEFCTDGTNVYLGYSAIADATHSYDYIRAYRWDATNKWQPMNNGDAISINNAYSAYQATIACGSSYVAWVQGSDPDGADDGYVADVTMTSSARSGAINRVPATSSYYSHVENVSAVADGTGVYVAMWEQNPVDPNESDRLDLFVSKWDGANLSNVGGLIGSDFEGAAEPTALVVDGADLYVAYTAVKAAGEKEMVYVARFDGADWATMGSALAAYEGDEHFEANDPDLIMVDGVLYVAWEESGNVCMAYWDAAQGDWVLNNQNRVINQHVTSDASKPSLAYSAGDDVFYISFLANVTGYDQVAVMKRNMQ